MGLWEITLHVAYWPQLSTQGSRHLFWMQASSKGHSEFVMHSGLHPMLASPKVPGRHSQMAKSPSLLQTALEPQGFGTHGSRTASGCTAT